MNFKEAIYRQYVNTHNKHLYGESTLEKFDKHKPTNDYYLSSFLPSEHSAEILDIGCGDGNLVYWMQQKDYKNVYGIDLSEEQIALGKKLGIKNLELADLKDYLEQSSKKYDLIIARDVFEHFTRQDFFDTLVRIKKVLKENGRLLIQVPNGQGIHYTTIFYGDVTHEMAYTQSSLRQLILASGFSDVKCYPVNPIPNGFKGKVRSFLWGLKVKKLRFWKMVETGNPSGIFTANLIAEIK